MPLFAVTAFPQGNIKINKAYFVSDKDHAVLKRFGYSYGILADLESEKFDIVDENGDEIKPVEFTLLRIDSRKRIKIDYTLNQFATDDENPKKIRYFLVGTFNPGNKYILEVNRGSKSDRKAVDSDTDIEKQMSSDEKRASYFYNSLNMDFDFERVTNQKNTFILESDLNLGIYKKGILNTELELEAEFATDDTLKSGFRFDLKSFEYQNLIKFNLGKELGKSYYFYNLSLGASMETDQKWKTRKSHLKGTFTLELPYTNVLSMKIHKQYNIRRSAPGLIARVSGLRNVGYTKNDDFANEYRLDISGIYNVTLSPIIYAKLKAYWYCDLEMKKWKNYQEHILAVKYNINKEVYYYVKYSKGIVPPDFDKNVEEIAIGLKTNF